MRDIKLFINCIALYFNRMLLNIKLRVRIVVETKEMVRFFSKYSYLNKGAEFQRSSAIGIPWGIVLLRIADEGLRTPASSIFFLDKHLAMFAIFISRLATSRKYAQNERVL